MGADGDVIACAIDRFDSEMLRFPAAVQHNLWCGLLHSQLCLLPNLPLELKVNLRRQPLVLSVHQLNKSDKMLIN